MTACRGPICSVSASTGSPPILPRRNSCRSGGENARPLFDGTASSVTFVRSAIGPNASAGLEIVRLSETDDARGRVLVRERAPFAPVTAEDLDAGELEFTNPIVLVRPPFHVSFAFAGRDRIWQETWHDVMQLPNAVRVTVRNAMTDQILPVSTAALLNVNAPAECVRGGARLAAAKMAEERSPPDPGRHSQGRDRRPSKPLRPTRTRFGRTSKRMPVGRQENAAK